MRFLAPFLANRYDADTSLQRRMCGLPSTRLQVSRLALGTVFREQRDEVFGLVRDQGLGVMAYSPLAVAFTLPFVTLMPVYGRLGDGLGKRRLILFGALLSSFGALLTSFSPTLGWLLIGRAIQGLGLAGVFLQYLIDRSVPTIGAYQRVFLAFVLFPVIGVTVALGLKRRGIDA